MREQTPARTLLQQLIRNGDMGYERLAEAITQFARDRGLPGTIGPRHLQRLARRERATSSSQPTTMASTRHLLSRYFQVPFDDLLGPPRPAAELAALSNNLLLPATPTDPRGIAAAAAQDSLKFLSWAQDDRVPAAVLDHISSELRRIAIEYVHRPILPLFGDLMTLRDAAFCLLQDRPHPRQARELFLVAGAVCTLLAHASHNLGSPSAAKAQAATAWACADQADHADLRAWVRGTQALIEEWTDHPDLAITLARDAQQYVNSGESRARLAAIEARARARAGDPAGALDALNRAERARDDAGRPDALAQWGGVLTFPRVKQLYYAGSTLALAGRYDDGERAAVEAIHLYETGPVAQRSYGDEALARVDVAVARAARDDLDGALAALDPVFALPRAQRIQQIAAGLERVRDQVALPGRRSSRVAREIADQVDAFPDPSGQTLAVRSSGDDNRHR